MTYTPTAAGHEEAPTERAVRVEEDPLVEAFFTHAASKSEFISTEEVREHFAAYFRGRPAWSEEHVNRVLSDPRSRLNCTIRENNMSYTYRLLELLRPSVLDACERLVLTQDSTFDRGELFAGLQNQARRVLVVHHSHKRTVAVGHKTLSTLYILTGEDSSSSAPVIFSSESVVVSFHGGEGQSVLNNLRWPLLPPLSWYFEERSGVLVRTEQNPTRRDIFYADRIKELPALDEYVRELVSHCRDPHSIHGRYGVTPGPNIRRQLTDISVTLTPSEMVNP